MRPCTHRRGGPEVSVDHGAALRANPSTAPRLPPALMSDLLEFVLFFGGWIVLQRWILPKAGVPT